jgi:hypothetical protein
MPDKSGSRLPRVPDSPIPGEPWHKLSSNEQVYRTIRECLLDTRCFALHPHCKDEMAKDNLDRQEVIAVLLHGRLVTPFRSKENPRWNRDSRPPEWSYEIECTVEDRNLTVVARFREFEGRPFLVAYTCWARDED